MADRPDAALERLRQQVAVGRANYDLGTPEKYPLAKCYVVILDAEAALAEADRLAARLSEAEREKDAAWAAAARQRKTVSEYEQALRLYADPTFYFGCGFLFDRPTGGFDEDFSEVPWPDGGTNFKPGKAARAALSGSAGTGSDAPPRPIKPARPTWGDRR